VFQPESKIHVPYCNKKLISLKVIQDRRGEGETQSPITSQDHLVLNSEGNHNRLHGGRQTCIGEHIGVCAHTDIYFSLYICVCVCVCVCDGCKISVV